MKKVYVILTLSMIIIGGSNLKAQIRKAERLYNAFDYAKAIPLYEKVANKDNKHSASAMVRLGDINRLSSHFDQAALWYSKAIANGNLDPEVFLNYGQILRSKGQYEEAILQFNKFTELNPNDNRGKLYADYCNQIINLKQTADAYEVFNLEEVNTPYADFSPVVLNDEMIFTSDRNSASTDKKYGWTGAYYLDLFKAEVKKGKGGELSVKNPQMYSSELNKPYHDGPATFTGDKNTIYFTRVLHRSGEIDSSRFYTNKLKIFSSTYNGSQWTTAKPFYLNSESYSVGHPAITPDGNTLYFVSDKPGGFGGTDLYSVTLNNGQWGNLTNLGEEINTFGNEMFPFVDSNGVLFFSSDGWPGHGSLDLFKTSFIDSTWIKPENLKEPINSSADDFGFYSDPNSGVMFLSSNRSGGIGADDIYLVKEIKYADSLLVSGIVKDRETGAVIPDAIVLLWEENAEEVSVYFADSNGGYSVVLKPGSNYVFKTVKKGYSTDCLSLNIPKLIRQTTLENRDLLIVKLKVDQVFRLEKIYYDFDKWDIRADATVELNKVVEFLQRNKEVSIELGSHTDSRGTNLYNDDLSQKRAQSAVDYIVSKGIQSDRITAKGYGEVQLINNCGDNIECSDDQHQANRRTEIKITGVAEESGGEYTEPLEAITNGKIIKLTDLRHDFFIDCMDIKEL